MMSCSRKRRKFETIPRSEKNSLPSGGTSCQLLETPKFQNWSEECANVRASQEIRVTPGFLVGCCKTRKMRKLRQKHVKTTNPFQNIWDFFSLHTNTFKNVRNSVGKPLTSQMTHAFSEGLWRHTILTFFS